MGYASVAIVRRRRAGVAMAVALLGLSGTAAEPPKTDKGSRPHTFDGRYDITTIDLTVVYLVPKDRRPLDDWRERVDYFMKRIAAFHERESAGCSRLRIRVHSEPLIAEQSADQIRGKDPDQTFEHSLREVQSALRWPPRRRDGFPILLVLSEINWRELDDFQRTRIVDGVARFEGSVDDEGRHFPGAESGGARAVYNPEEGLGMGLVSADGWRVPYTGSDCVVYHEGIGHPIGLPHPEPIDDSVMGVAQYKFWLNQTRVDDSQKRALGWPTGAEADLYLRTRRFAGTAGQATRPDLFTGFTAVPSPAVPRPRQAVRLRLHWPERAELRTLKVSLQTDLRGPWLTLPLVLPNSPPAEVDIGSFERPTPVSYRVEAVLRDGQSVELRGYFQVKGPASDSLRDYLVSAPFRRYLPAMKEPDLRQLAAKDRTATVYRFIWMPSFHDLVSVRFVKTEDGATLDAVRLRLPEELRPGGVVVERRSARLKPAHWERIARHVETARFWEMPNRPRHPTSPPDAAIADGDFLVVEGVRDGRYHVVFAHSFPAGNFVDLCQAMLFMSGIDVKNIWFEYRD
jgi:hypothetical protein